MKGRQLHRYGQKVDSMMGSSLGKNGRETTWTKDRNSCRQGRRVCAHWKGLRLKYEVMTEQLRVREGQMKGI